MVPALHFHEYEDLILLHLAHVPDGAALTKGLIQDTRGGES